MGILGHNGSGKSTSIKILVGHSAADLGRGAAWAQTVLARQHWVAASRASLTGYDNVRFLMPPL